MLVLSRRTDEAFRFPDLGITVRILGVRGKRVRVGIDAPPEVAVLRDEVAEEIGLPRRSTPDRMHVLRNRLNAIRLGMDLAERQVTRDRLVEAERTLEMTLEEFAQLERQLNDASAPPTVEPPRVLLVEDDPNELRLLAGILELEGFHVDTARDGEEAVARLRDSRPDLVLLDMRMPRRNGPETVRWIRERAELDEIRVLSLSASSPEEVGVSIGPDGIDEWIAKPLDPAWLLHRIKALTTVA